MKKLFIVIAGALIMASCSSTKSLQNGTQKLEQQEQKNDDLARINYLRRVSDNAVYSKNITAKIDFTIDAMGKNISVDGRMYMRKDECIRIQVVPFGLMEVARLEFTPNYVLLIDRMHKEYVKASYTEVDFLKNNGMSFYTLQSLFWNELFVPGKQTLSDSDLAQFKADMAQEVSRLVTTSTDLLDFAWTTDVASANITRTDITYGKNTKMVSNVALEYGDFVPMGSKRFPSKEVLSFESALTNKGKMTLTILMSKINNDSNWEANTAIPGKYTEVKATELLGRLVSF